MSLPALTCSEGGVDALPEARGSVRQPERLLLHQVELGVETELSWHGVADLLEPDLQVKGHSGVGVAGDGAGVSLLHRGGAGDQLHDVVARIVTHLEHTGSSH